MYESGDVLISEQGTVIKIIEVLSKHYRIKVIKWSNGKWAEGMVLKQSIYFVDGFYKPKETKRAKTIKQHYNI